ncbi:MAG TPA: putative aminohydrolase SsnA [Blastocatellia bacterium]|nr:putative aminohydrolase SsnA [Blastocatellia bacterium]
MALLLTSGTVIGFDPPSLQQRDLRIEDDRIAETSSHLTSRPGDHLVDCTRKLIAPGMVCAHTHLYSSLARGMPPPPRTPQNFKEILELIWWRLDRALDEQTIYYSALAGAMDAAAAGTTCVFDHHASPAHISGSLEIIQEAIEQVGIRAVLSYEVTDRGGKVERDRGVLENRRFLESCRRLAQPASGATGQATVPQFAGLVGAHASFTLSDDSLQACAELAKEFDSGVHIHVAEDALDVEDSRQTHGEPLVERLLKRDVLGSRAILAHGVHLSAREIDIVKETGAWFAHNPRSNMNNQVGYASTSAMESQLLLGTDGIGSDMFEETRFAYFKGRDGHTGLGADNWLRVLANNQRVAADLFGADLSSLDVGSAADLVILDYQSPTPINAENIAWHFVFGFGSSAVESTMVGGRFLIKDRQPCFDAASMRDRARRASEWLWERMSQI